MLRSVYRRSKTPADPTHNAQHTTPTKRKHTHKTDIRSQDGSWCLHAGDNILSSRRPRTSKVGIHRMLRGAYLPRKRKAGPNPTTTNRFIFFNGKTRHGVRVSAGRLVVLAAHVAARRHKKSLSRSARRTDERPGPHSIGRSHAQAVSRSSDPPGGDIGQINR